MYLDTPSQTDTTPHTRVRPASGTCHVSITAPAQADSVATLRRRASMLFAWAMSADERSTAALVISELLTNAVMHGHSEMTLVIALTGSVLEITVTDHGKPKTSSTPPSDADEHGRGLVIVSAVTRDVRIDETATGWRTRAVMDLASADPTATGASEVQLRVA
ncbi:ATP-binding protein [Streptomyces sp. NBC_00322]|uniref:ATP-binding protein n=1 Tax=Streptomyces sp. NBC_00322 TaxID=2975712 RepID=UPI002E2E6103|nr:ATP-binding protein [Streptomyces sp. NBC_00322]